MHPFTIGNETACHSLQCLCPNSTGKSSNQRQILFRYTHTIKHSANGNVPILGDIDARVGRNSEAWKGDLRKHDASNC